MSFIETRFFEDHGPNVTGGPRYATTITTLRGGGEHRVKRWSSPLRQYSLGLGAREIDAVAEFEAFLHRTGGAFAGFRLKDWKDYKSCTPQATVSPFDQALGTGDGTTFWFRLNKSYPDYTRRITKPLPETIRVAFDGAEVDDETFFVDSVNGTVVFVDPPAADVEITWGGEFDVPVRFETDSIDTSTFFHGMGHVPSIDMREIRITEDITEADYTTIRDLAQVSDYIEITRLADDVDELVNTNWKAWTR